MFTFLAWFFVPIILLILALFYFCTFDKFKLKPAHIAPGRFFEKVEFENHSYVYLRNKWNAGGDQLLHDPDCQCLRKQRE